MKLREKKTAALLIAIFMISFFAVVMVSAQTNSSAKPVYKLRIDTKPNKIDVWNYVKNPSNSFERDDIGPLHNVEVQYLTMTLIQPGEEPYPYRFFPDGYVEDLITGEKWYRPEFGLRWDTTVHPGETSLVYYGGWGDLTPGVWQFIYELSVEYEGTTYELVKKFNINIREH